MIVNLDPTVGSEIRKIRPCLIISPDEMNKYLSTITIAPITSTSKDHPTRVKFILNGNPSWIALDQIRTIDNSRIIKSTGELSQKEIRKVKTIIKEIFVD